MSESSKKSSSMSFTKYTLDKIFLQAMMDVGSVNLDGEKYEARLQQGIKIIKDLETQEIKIYNTHRGGDYYVEISDDEYYEFLEKGWRFGVYVVSLSNYRQKLEVVKDTIKNLANNKATKKQLEMFHERRDRILEKYSEIKEKLNQLN